MKIGYSASVVRRISQLGTLRPGNFALRLIGCFPGGVSTERWLHQKFADIREDGEWFRSTPELRQFIAALGVTSETPQSKPKPTEPQPPPVPMSETTTQNQEIVMATKKEVSDAAATLGRRGGRKKVPKGLAMMDPEQARKIRSAGGKARWKNKDSS